MCGAFSITYPFKEGWDKPFNAGYNFPEPFKPRFNARPGQSLPVILNSKPDEIQLINWGLKPNWLKGKILINVRDDSLATKPMYYRDLKERRCIIPADGFYEWTTEDRKKTPYRFVLKSKKLFAFAGIWQPDPKTNQPQFAIITTEPNQLVKKYHNRMPVILPARKESEWLNTTLAVNKLLDLLKPYPANLMLAYSVSTLVNSPKNDFAQITKPVKI